MRIFFISVLSVLAYSIGAEAQNIEGVWEDDCSDYGDSTFYGTYSYDFKSNGKVHAFIQHYRDSRCTQRMEVRSTMANGTYTLVTNAAGKQELHLQFSHLETPIIFQVQYSQNSFSLCNNNKKCKIYERR